MRVRSTACLATVVFLVACGGGGDGGPSGPGPTTNGSVRGVVNDQTGTGVPSASVALQATGQTTRNTTTDGSGNYSFGAVAAGTYTIAVTPPAGFQLGTSTGTTTVTVVAGQQASATTLTLTRNAVGGPAPQFAEVSMANTSFQPATVEVAVGGTVRFTNNDSVIHNATANGVNTGNLNPGQSSNQPMPTARTINYNCTLHAGMSGTIIVR